MRTLLALAAVAPLVGCASSATSNTARTAMEQMLVANAVDQSLDKVDFRPFAGQTVFLNDKYVDCTDKNYVIASVRHRILAQGARLVDAADAADIVVELRTGSVGTDMSESFLGTPEIVLPGMMTIPEIKLVTRNKQTATAKIGLVAMNKETKQVLGSGGLSTAVSDNVDTKVLGVGIGTMGSLVSEYKRSTTGANRAVRPQLPARVAFAPLSPAKLPATADPIPNGQPSPVEFAGGMPSGDGGNGGAKAGVTPAAHETPFRMEWNSGPAK